MIKKLLTISLLGIVPLSIYGADDSHLSKAKYHYQYVQIVPCDAFGQPMPFIHESLKNRYLIVTEVEEPTRIPITPVSDPIPVPSAIERIPVSKPKPKVVTKKVSPKKKKVIPQKKTNQKKKWVRKKKRKI